MPFVIAFGFATAAGTHMMVERFGPVVAYWALTGGFLLLGFVAMLVVREKEHEEKVGDPVASASDPPSGASDAAAQAAVQAPLALLAAAFSTPLGPTVLAGGAKFAVRNLPLVVMLALMGVLFWPNSSTEIASDADEPLAPAGGPQNGAYRVT